MGKVVEFTRVTGSQASQPSAPGRGAAKPLWRHALGEVLRGERLEQERILTEVAAAAGVSPQYLSEIERGRKEPSSEVLGSVAEALGLDLVDVVERVGSLLGERRETDRREAERRELLRIETSFAFRADAGALVDLGPEHPLAVAPAAPSAYLLAA
ncbi:transcriptional regulator with XRE-family HTH domain [Agromyces cerinus]|uniref:helix-turn-helix domain-containing protein n=1 Tax=Agromyces cerinus TaxID=33878 RepID=UPI001957E323|nr:helix-turn-helix transcriptional regulator [Agromyces cerinus]MBM7831568.1 transcriptional regulator with XRE-family HTH domain [Agromyces cerinus]